MNSAAILRTFAELAADGEEGTAPVPIDVVGDGDFCALTYRALGYFDPSGFPRGKRAIQPMGAADNTLYELGEPRRERALQNHGTEPWLLLERSRQSFQRLNQRAALHRGEALLRIGWIWFAGTLARGDEQLQYCFPALSLPLVSDLSGPKYLSRRQKWLKSDSADTFWVGGDIEVTPLITDPDARDRILNTAHFGDGKLFNRVDPASNTFKPIPLSTISALPGLMPWCTSIADALGLVVSRTFAGESQHHPIDRRHEGGISLQVGCGLYLADPAPPGSSRSELLALAGLDGLDRSAVGSVYGESEVEARAREVIPLRPLTARQRRVAGTASASDLSVISGAPGTGKSHVLSVVAANAMARGESVLIVADSPHAVDVLMEHFAHTPGPTPVAFGGSRYGNELISELRTLLTGHEKDLASSNSSRQDLAAFDNARQAVIDQLVLEQCAITLLNDSAFRLDTVDELNRVGDLDELAALEKRVRSQRGFGFGHRKRRKALENLIGSVKGAEQVIEDLQLKEAALAHLAADGLSLDEELEYLFQTETKVAELRGQQFVGEWISGLGDKERETISQVVDALQSNRAERRVALAQIDPKRLLRAVPLWVGSVRDVDEVLPTVPALFDLAILDEASQIDQMHAASVLVRARRAVVCGDPAQLGHSSQLSDDEIRVAAAKFGVDSEVINPRKLSAFDVAAAQAPTEFLDEHFRSVPHLIEFSSRRFYDGTLHVATRHPSNEAADHIDVLVVDGERDSDYVNHVEVAECMRQVERYGGLGYTSIGLISPFRAQAEALERALLEVYDVELIERLGLRVGTVRAFQGDESDVLIVSLSLGADEDDSVWRYVNQRSLFNVMVTRAREQLVMVTSNAKPPGLAGEYLRWAEPLTGLEADADISDPWTLRVARALAKQGLPVRTGYRVGREIVDIVAGDGPDAVAIDCRIHSDGPEAHIERRLLLRRQGWRTVDAFQTKWNERSSQFAIELASTLTTDLIV